MKYGSRKWILAILIVLVSSLLVYIGSITAAIWGSTIGVLIVAYFTANVAQKKVADGSRTNE